MGSNIQDQSSQVTLPRAHRTGGKEGKSSTVAKADRSAKSLLSVRTIALKEAEFADSGDMLTAQMREAGKRPRAVHLWLQGCGAPVQCCGQGPEAAQGSAGGAQEEGRSRQQGQLPGRAAGPGHQAKGACNRSL